MEWLAFVPDNLKDRALLVILILSLLGSVFPKLQTVPYVGRVFQLAMGVGFDREKLSKALTKKEKS